MNYFELSCTCQPGDDIPEILIARLAELGFESFTEEEGEVKAYIASTLYSPEIVTELHSGEWSRLIAHLSVSEIADQNWNSLWESAYEPVVVAGKCMVRAPFHPVNSNIDFDILIEPKMSFGTAHHETTRLMLEYVLELDMEGKRILDMGSGTAVLAILAAMKKAASVTAIDNDEWAYQNARENVIRNNLDWIGVFLGDVALLRGKQFDIILANINRNILLNDIPSYAACLPKDGLLVMSGFYASDLEAIKLKAMESGFVLMSSKSDKDWTAACFIRREDPSLI